MKTYFSKLMLISVASAGVILAGQAPADAPATPAPPMQAHRAPDPQKQLNRLSKKLALTGDQQNQILPILTDRQQQVASVHGDATLSVKQRNAKLKAIRSDSESRLRNVLTDTQRTAYDQMEQDARARAHTRKQTGTAVQ